ncbi:MAG: PIN domain-containing protein [Salinisphaera sp.]|nr:PIN domain-containing protein [Salinisphaera sp.]MDN5938251.1 PIN domain-containing protein [Salinisphaera sp.]
MILVDSSVWIEHFRAGTNFVLEDWVALDEVVTCWPVVQEVLQGFDDQRAFALARDAMIAFSIVESPLGAEVFGAAVDLYRSARRAGIAVRSSVDCLIAACALRNGLAVLHQDRDFDGLARIAPLAVQNLRRA